MVLYLQNRSSGNQLGQGNEIPLNREWFCFFEDKSIFWGINYRRQVNPSRIVNGFGICRIDLLGHKINLPQGS